MKLALLPRSAGLSKRGYRIVLAAALLVAVVTLGGLSRASVAHAGGGEPGPLVNVNSGLCLDVPEGSLTPGTMVQQWPCNGQDNQQWAFQPVAPNNNIFTIVNVHSQLCLDDTGYSTSPGTTMDQWTCVAGARNQEWFVYSVSNNSVALFLLNINSLQCLDDPGYSTSPGTIMDQWTCVAGAPNQQWQG